jgi:hypothetical protein
MRPRLLLIAAGLVACSSTEPGVAGLRLDASLDRATVQRDDSVRVGLILSNVSKDPIQVTPAEAYGICMHAYEVFDSRGRPVSVLEALCALMDLYFPGPVTLPPNQRIVITDWWRPADSRLDGAPLVPGPYTVRGRAFAGEHTARARGLTVMVQ